MFNDLVNDCVRKAKNIDTLKDCLHSDIDILCYNINKSGEKNCEELRGYVDTVEFPSNIVFFGQKCPCNLDLVDELLIEKVKEINDEIEGLRHYGLRKNKVKRGRTIIWSNGSEVWYDGGNANTREMLDANMLNIPNIKVKDLKKIICCLDPLPLFAYSSEYKREHPEESESIGERWRKKIQEAKDREIFESSNR